MLQSCEWICSSRHFPCPSSEDDESHGDDKKVFLKDLPLSIGLCAKKYGLQTTGLNASKGGREREREKEALEQEGSRTERRRT